MVDKKFLLVTDEGCYSDYGFHMAVVDEQTARLVLEKYKLAKERSKDIDSHKWDSYIKHPRHIQEIVGEPIFSDVCDHEWNWLDDKAIKQLIRAYDYIIEHGFDAYDENKYELDLR